MLKFINLFNPRKAQTQQKQKHSRSSLLHSFQQVSGRNCRFPAGATKTKTQPLFSSSSS
ncbi:hypothetical protein Hanom_Chr08g00723271 [Helianthus anomalus]